METLRLKLHDTAFYVQVVLRLAFPFLTCIAFIPKLLHTLIIAAVFYIFFLISASCPLPCIHNLGIPGQQQLKATTQQESEAFLNIFLGGTGENQKRLQRQTLWL